MFWPQHPRCWDQNTSQIQILRHFEKRGRDCNFGLTPHLQTINTMAESFGCSKVMFAWPSERQMAMNEFISSGTLACPNTKTFDNNKGCFGAMELPETRKSFLLHAKFMVMLDARGQELWGYAGSHNASANAFGRYMTWKEDTGKQSMIKCASFEAGVVFTGRTLADARRPFVTPIRPYDEASQS